MEPSLHSDVLSARSPRLCRIVNWIFTRKLQKNFYAVKALQVPPKVDGPLIICMNHPSWNDPMVISFLTHHFFPDREAYGPIDGDALDGYKFLARTGLYPVSHGSPASARQFLRTSQAILNRPNTVIWITAQGKFTDPRVRPVTLESGLGFLLQSADHTVTTLPLAVEYAYGEEQYPEIFVSFGEAVSEANDARAAQWKKACENGLQKAQDKLAEQVIARNDEAFVTILGGAAGVGGVYGFWQRMKCILRGEKYDPRHSSLT